MNSIVIAFFACLALTNASILVTPSAKILQGPSSRSTIAGPDGSSISSETSGGAIVDEERPAVVTHAAPVIAYTAPAISYSAPAIAYSTLPLTYPTHSFRAPALAYEPRPIVSTYSAPWRYSAPLAYSTGYVTRKELDTLVAGPSGTIATTKDSDYPVLVDGVRRFYL